MQSGSKAAGTYVKDQIHKINRKSMAVAQIALAPSGPAIPEPPAAVNSRKSLYPQVMGAPEVNRKSHHIPPAHMTGAWGGSTALKQSHSGWGSSGMGAGAHLGQPLSTRNVTPGSTTFTAPLPWGSPRDASGGLSALGWMEGNAGVTRPTGMPTAYGAKIDPSTGQV